ncbi:MAG: hypothetical protein ACD_71C00055G0001, partial [uncultured bacterium (gcode 4)]
LSNNDGEFPIYGASGLIKNVDFYHQEEEYIGIVKDGAGIGRLALLPEKSSVIGTMQYILPYEGVDIKFLYYSLLSIDFLKHRQGSTIPHIYFKDYSEEEITVPPLSEQLRIVSILDEALEKLGQAKENIEKNLQNAKDVFESYLQNIFANPWDDWEEKNLGEIATFRNWLNFTKGSKGETIKIVGVKDFQKSFWVPFDSLESVIIDGKLNEIDFLKENDILAVRSNGNPELIGRVILAGDFIGTVSHSGFTIRIRADSKILAPLYLCHYLKTKGARRELVESGVWVGIKSLNQAILSSLIIPFPKSLPEQLSIVSKLNTLSAETKHLESIYQQKLAHLDELRKSLLKKAFNGKL